MKVMTYQRKNLMS